MNITVLGTGFAGLEAIKRVRKNSPQATISVIAPSNTFVYYPSLIWLPSGLRTADDLVHNLSDYFKKYNVQFIEAKVTGITEAGRCVQTDQGEYKNDGLIIATGCQFQKELSGLEHVHIMCQGIDSATAIKHKLDGMTSGNIAIGYTVNNDEPTAIRGVGAMLEFVFVIDKLLRKKGRRDDIKMTFFTSESQIASSFGEQACEKLLEIFAKQNIDVVLKADVKGFEANKVLMSDQAIEADLILFQPSMTGADWLDNTDLPRSPAGLIEADSKTQVLGFDNTYVAGEVASYPEPEWQSKSGVGAVNQAQVAVSNLISSLDGKAGDKEIRHKLIYIIDTLDAGIFIKRTPDMIKFVPEKKLFHFVKRIIEWLHLRKFG